MLKQACSSASFFGERLSRAAMTDRVREVGILFGDVAGSTRLYDTLGDRAALAAIDACLRIVSDAVLAHGGTIVKTIGDELMAAFPRADATHAAAVEIQQRMDTMPALPSARGPIKLFLRVGFHFGPAIEDRSDFFGDTVNLAARMVGLARGGQIITTAETLALVPAAQRGPTRDLQEIAVRGKAGGVRTIEVLWQESSERTTLFIPGIGAPAPPKRARLSLGNRERHWDFDDGQDSIALGRDPSCAVVVNHSGASRIHATIERRRDKWVLIDHSTNGTFVTFAGERELRLHREELILRGDGVISFGQSADHGGAESLRFALT